MGDNIFEEKNLLMSGKTNFQGKKWGAWIHLASRPYLLKDDLLKKIFDETTGNIKSKFLYYYF